MSTFTFKKFLEEQERSFETVRQGLDNKGLNNEVYRQAINASLAKTCSHTFITPYIALGSIARVLAYAHIILPQVTIEDKEQAQLVFDAQPLGDDFYLHHEAGVGLLSEPAPKFYVYFAYHIEPDGYYDVFAKVVDDDELQDLLDGEEDIDDDSRLTEAKKVDLKKWHEDRVTYHKKMEKLARTMGAGKSAEHHAHKAKEHHEKALKEEPLDEVSSDLLARYRTKAGRQWNKLRGQAEKGDEKAGLKAASRFKGMTRAYIKQSNHKALESKVKVKATGKVSTQDDKYKSNKK